MSGNSQAVRLVSKNETTKQNNKQKQSIIQVNPTSDSSIPHAADDDCTKIANGEQPLNTVAGGHHNSPSNDKRLLGNHTNVPVAAAGGMVKIEAPPFKIVDSDGANNLRQYQQKRTLISSPSAPTSVTNNLATVSTNNPGNTNQFVRSASNCDGSNQQSMNGSGDGNLKRVQFNAPQLLDNSRQPTVIKNSERSDIDISSNRPRVRTNNAGQELINFNTLHSFDSIDQCDTAFHDNFNNSLTNNTHAKRQLFTPNSEHSEESNDNHANLNNNNNFGNDDDDEYEWYNQDIVVDSQLAGGRRNINSAIGSPSRYKPRRQQQQATYVGRAVTKLKFFTSGLTNKILGTSSSIATTAPYTSFSESSSQDNQDLLTGTTKYHRSIDKQRFSKRSSTNSGRTFRGSYRYSRIGIVMAIFRKLINFLTHRSTLALFGAFLIHITLGTVYTLSNVNSYLTSYMRKHGTPNATYGGSMWISSSFAVGQGLSMVMGGYLERRFSARIPCFLGCALHSLSIMSTSKSIDHGHLAVLLTYGLLPGFGCGLAYMTPMSNGFGWFPNRKGLVAGVILAGFGIGSFVFNMAQTAFVNPQNLSPPSDSGGYFVQESILTRVPHLFIFLGAIYASMQFIGCCLLFKPPNAYNPADKLSDLRPIIEETEPMSIKEAIRSREFIVLFLVYGITNQGVLFVNSMLKEYAQIFIDNDLFLAWTGSMASIANSLGRLTWGMAIDKFSFTQCFTTITTIFGILMFIMPFEFVLSSKLLYLLCSLGIFGSFSGWMSTYPVHISRVFGNQISGVIYGLIFVSQSIGGILTAFGAHYLIDNYNRFVPFFCVSLLEVLGLVIYHLFYNK